MVLYFREVKDGYIVYRQGTERHSHFRSRKAAKNFMKLIHKRLMPRSDYYKESARRLLTEEEYNHLKTEGKQKYYNKARAIR